MAPELACIRSGLWFIPVLFNGKFSEDLTKTELPVFTNFKTIWIFGCHGNHMYSLDSVCPFNLMLSFPLHCIAKLGDK